MADLRRKARFARAALEARGRRATSFIRSLPNFLIIGGMKCGTTSLYSYLLKHPAVGGYKRKEVFHFDLNYHRGIEWYRSHFPLLSFGKEVRRRFGIEPLIGEATAQYLFHPLAPARVSAFDPNMKLIVLLRDVVDRAFRITSMSALTAEGLSLSRTLFDAKRSDWKVNLGECRKTLPTNPTSTCALAI